MDHLFLLQFACFLFMLFNAFTLARHPSPGAMAQSAL